MSEDPDVEITTRAKARELTHHEPPDVHESTQTDPEGESTTETDRANLPKPTKPGVTYQDLQISHRLAAKLPDPDDPSIAPEKEDES